MSNNEHFEQSYLRLFGEGVGIRETATPFFEAFYRNFLIDSEVSEFFSGTDMTRQVAMLRKSFFHLVAFYTTHEPSAELERIARVHDKLGIQHDHYDRWLDALINTVQEHDPKCDLATEFAWRWAMTPGLTYMRLLGHFRENPTPSIQP